MSFERGSRPPGIILAGGQSRRMGGTGDKFLMPLGGRPLLGWVIERARTQTDGLALSSNSDPATLAAFGLAVLLDLLPGRLGPLAGIATGLRWAESSSDLLAVFAADTPFFPVNLIARLTEALRAEQADIAIPISNGRRHGVFGIWRTAMRAPLERALTQDDCRKVERFLADRKVAQVTFAVDPHDPFFNINRPGDLEMAERLAANIQSS